MKHDSVVSLDVGGKWFSIPLDKLQIFENDIYNVKSKSDILI